MSFVGKWMELGDIILSEISLSHKDKHHILLLRPRKMARTYKGNSSTRKWTYGNGGRKGRIKRDGNDQTTLYRFRSNTKSNRH